MILYIKGEKYLSVDEVEKLVGYKKSTINVKVQYNAFPKPQQLHFQRLWKRSEIESYLKTHKKKKRRKKN